MSVLASAVSTRRGVSVPEVRDEAEGKLIFEAMQLPADLVFLGDSIDEAGARLISVVPVTTLEEMFGAQFPASVSFGARPRVFDKLLAAGAEEKGYKLLFDALKAENRIW